MTVRQFPRALRGQMYRLAHGRCLHPGCQGLAMLYVDLDSSSHVVCAMPVCCKHDYSREKRT